MSNYIRKLRYKFVSLDTSLPTMEKVFPYVAVVVSICVLYGIVTTIIGFQKYRHDTSSENKKAVQTSHSKPSEVSSVGFPFIIQRNIFNIAGTIPDGDDTKVSTCPLEPPVTNLPYKIQGILYGGSAQSSLVIFEGDSEKQNNIFRVGDKLPQGGVLTDIAKDKILITNKECPESLSLDYKLPDLKRSRGEQVKNNTTYKENGFERNGLNTTVTKQWMNNILNNNFDQALQDVRATPNIVNGQIKGFNLTQIVPNSVYSKLGFQNGDIISAINGVELTDAARAIQTLNSLRNENKFEIRITRNGQPLTLKVNAQ